MEDNDVTPNKMVLIRVTERAQLALEDLARQLSYVVDYPTSVSHAIQFLLDNNKEEVR